MRSPFSPVGGLEAEISSLSETLLSSPHDWEARSDALQAMGSSIRRHSTAKHDVTKEVLRKLSRPLTITLMDLRSSLVRGACVLLEILAETCGDRLRYLLRDIMGTILQVIGSTNSVIVEYVDSAFRYIIDTARFPREIPNLVQVILQSHSREHREHIASYLLLILQKWPPVLLENQISHIEKGISSLLQDASSQAREIARSAFPVCRKHWPQQAQNILDNVDPRTARILAEGASGVSSSTQKALPPHIRINENAGEPLARHVHDDSSQLKENNNINVDVLINRSKCDENSQQFQQNSGEAQRLRTAASELLDSHCLYVNDLLESLTDDIQFISVQDRQMPSSEQLLKHVEAIKSALALRSSIAARVYVSLDRCASMLSENV